MISKTEMEKIRKILRKAEVKKPVKKPVKKVTKTKSNVIRDAYGWPLKKGMIVIDEKGGRFYDDVAKVIRFDGNHVIVEGKDYESRRKKRLLESPGDFSRPDKQINTHSGTRRYAKGYEDNPSKLRIVHRSPNGGRVWRDGEWGQYRYAPAGVGPRGVRGDDVNVGFTDDLQDAIASLAETERRGVRRENPRHEYLYWLPGVDTEYGYMPGNYEIAFSEAQRRGLEKFGGVDVSDDPKAWQEYDRLIQEAYNERL